MLETRGVFLDMSKGLGGIGHEGLLFNSNKMILVEISSTNFKHLGITYGVKPNGQISDWETICAVVSHGSIKLPLFLLLTNVLKSNLKLFADDNCLFLEICHPLETARTLNNDLRKISKWAKYSKNFCNRYLTKQAQDLIFFRKSHFPKHLIQKHKKHLIHTFMFSSNL